MRAVFALVAVGSCACSSGGRESRAAVARSGDGAAQLLPVAVVAVVRRDLARGVTVTGPVEPLRTIGVTSQTSGSVLAVHVQEGDRVAEGTLLAELDAREAESQFARAQAVLESARDAFARDSQLHAGAIITDADFERTRSAYMVAKSEAELWDTRRAFTRITAPSAGVVTAKHVEAGSAVSPNQRLFDIADVSLLVVRVQLSELDVVHIDRGAAVAVRLDAYPGARLEGRVRRIFPSADPQSRLVPVEVALGPRPARVDVRAGFLARVDFALDRRTDALAVPAAAIGVASTEPSVYVVEADTLVQRRVTLGVTEEGWVEVTAGVREGEQVVVSGHTNLRPGARVRVQPGGPGPRGAPAP
jgi:membrane fusion protein, multidrug efflux system